MNYEVYMLYSDGTWKAKQFFSEKEAEWWAKKESMYNSVSTWILEEI